MGDIVMYEALISFETAKLAKEKGFNIHTLYYYNSDNPLSYNIELKQRGWGNLDSLGVEYTNVHEQSGLLDYQITPINNAPTQSLLQKWLREVSGVNIYVESHGGIVKPKWSPVLQGIGHDEHESLSNHDTYEEALEAGLLYLLQLV